MEEHASLRSSNPYQAPAVDSQLGPPVTAHWTGATLGVDGWFVRHFFWLTPELIVTLDGVPILKTSRPSSAMGNCNGTFSWNGVEHQCSLSWGLGTLTTFPVTVTVDHETLIQVPLRMKNPQLLIIPIAAIVLFCATPYLVLGILSAMETFL